MVNLTVMPILIKVRIGDIVETLHNAVNGLVLQVGSNNS